jgi:hypothetical protein
MRAPADVAREILSKTGILKPPVGVLTEAIKTAQAEAYREGMQVGMHRFFEMAAGVGRRVNGEGQLDMFGDPHDNVLSDYTQSHA